MLLCFFCFKQKTAYEMRTSDWSSDVCSSDLGVAEVWSDQEIDHIVADYFAMLTDELVGRSFNKAARNRDLQAVIDRSKGSIEFKHQNISAVLLGLGQPWIEGYKPADRKSTRLNYSH